MKMKAMNKLVAVIAALAAFSLAATAAAQEAPDVLIKRITTEIQQAAKADKAIQSGNNQRMVELVEDKLAPHLYVGQMAAHAMGRYWRDASQDQRAIIERDLWPLVLLSYVAAFPQGNAEIKFLPFAADPGAANVEVRTEIVRSGGDPAPLYYRLEKTDDGWKIFDINLSGSWLMEARQRTFAVEIQKDGIDGLIKALAQELKTHGVR